MHRTPVHKTVFWGLILAITLPGQTIGQITAPTADYTDSLSYSHTEGRDPLFVFYQINGAHRAGSLTATLTDTGSFDFQWSRYNPAISGFDPPFSSETDVHSSNVTELAEGGYRVRIFNGSGTDTTMLAWVMLDHHHAWVHKTAEGNLDPGYYDCTRLALNGYVEPDSLIYYDPTSHIDTVRVLEFRFKWTSDNSDLKIPNDTIILAPNITYQPPYEDTWYILTATDEMGMVEVDSVYYESIQTKAKFSVEYWDKFKNEFDPDLTEGANQLDLNDLSNSTGSTDATLTVRFINKSLNGATFEWVFLDTLGGIKETDTTYDTTEMPEFTYETADKYFYPYLFSYSEEGCVDSVKIEEGIHVVRSELIIPNVFTPNGDGRNEIWYFKHQSLKTCKITVVDRTGKVVYKKKIDNIYTWEGWNGNMHESNRRAPEGQYYFVVEAMGYDGSDHSDATIWETMKIFGGTGIQNTGGTGGTGGSNPGGGSGTEPQSTNLYTGWLYLYR